jgi:hypothetical protein
VLSAVIDELHVKITSQITPSLFFIFFYLELKYNKVSVENLDTKFTIYTLCLIRDISYTSINTAILDKSQILFLFY